MEFKRDEARERHGREFKHKERWFGPHATLVSYFEKNPDDPQTPADVKEGETWPWFYRFGDGAYRDKEGLVLTYETNCETADVIAEIAWAHHADEDRRVAELCLQVHDDPDVTPVLLDILEERGIVGIPANLLAARKVVQWASWCSAWFFHHAQSIEGDYELFDAFEADWLGTQELPQRWTRMGLLILQGSVRNWVEHDDIYTLRQRPGEPWPPESKREGAPPSDPPSDTDWRRADMLIASIGFDYDDLHPHLGDFFC